MPNVFARMPWSLWWFTQTAIAYLLLNIPGVAMFLGWTIVVPLWFVITLNLGFASIVPEALKGRIAKSWLLVPAVWFGGYYTAAITSHVRVARLDAQFRAHNAAERIPFDSATHTLVIDASIREMLLRDTEIVRDYRIPVIYETARRGTDVFHRAMRLMTEPDCRKISQNALTRNAGVLVRTVPDDHPILRRRKLTDICVVTAPEEPTLPAIVVSGKKDEQKQFIAPHLMYRIAIKDAEDKELAHPIAGVAWPLEWLPMPMIACNPFLWVSKGECSVIFARGTTILGGRETYGSAVDDVVAATLGLKRAHAVDRRKEFAAATNPAIEIAAQSVATRMGALLDDVIADPAADRPTHRLRVLMADVSIYKDRAPAMVQAMSRALENGRSTYHTARVLQELLAHLPRADFEAIGPGLLNILSAQDPLNNDTVLGTLAARLGDLGPAALPILEKMIFPTSGRRADYAIYGLCRVGAAAGRYADVLVDRVAERRWSDATVAIYVTLRRLGRDDLIARNSNEGAPFARPSGLLLERTITPKSPPSACVDHIGRPRLPE
jgi:hypothetical protein